MSETVGRTGIVCPRNPKGTRFSLSSRTHAAGWATRSTAFGVGRFSTAAPPPRVAGAARGDRSRVFATSTADRPAAGATGPLIVSADPDLIADLSRLAAAAGATPMVLEDPASVARAWSTAPAVLVGVDLAPALSLTGPPRRARVQVVGAGQLPDSAYRAALGCGAEEVTVLPEGAPALMELLTDLGDGAVRAATTVGVVGGAGGVGATVFAAVLADACAERVPTVLVDGDALGAGVDEVLGMDGVDGIRWDAVLTATGRLGGRALRDALPKRDRLAVLAWPRDHRPEVDEQAAREVLSAARRGFEVVVLDLPRHRHVLSDELLPRCDLVLLVTTSTVPAVAASARIVRRLPASATRLVVRETPGGVDPAEAARFLGVPVAAVMGRQRRLDEALSLGIGPVRGRRGALRSAARAVAGDLVGSSVAGQER